MHLASVVIFAGLKHNFVTEITFICVCACLIL